MRTRGKRVTAEATIPRDVLIQHMRVDPETLHYHAGIANVGAFLSGANNNGCHSPNGITAMFIATGQDVANVAESSAGIVYTEVTPDGGSLHLDHHPVADRGHPRRRHRPARPSASAWRSSAASARARCKKLAEIVAGRGARRARSRSPRRSRRSTGCRATSSTGGTGRPAAVAEAPSIPESRPPLQRPDGCPQPRRRVLPPAEPPPLPRSASPGFEMLPDKPPQGLVRRFFTIQRHLIGLAFGALVAHAREGRRWARGGGFRLLFWLERLLAALVRPFLDRTIADRPFPVQLRRRLEILGPTYIKLGQVLALRQDILPQSITDELKNLLDRLPVVPFDRYLRADRGGPRAADRRDVLLDRPDPHRLGLDRPDPPRHDARRGLGDPQGGQAGHPRDAEPRRHPAAHPGRRSSSSSSPATGRSS